MPIETTTSAAGKKSIVKVIIDQCDTEVVSGKDLAVSLSCYCYYYIFIPLCSGCDVRRLSRRNADLIRSFSFSDCMPRISTENPSWERNAWSPASCSRTKPTVTRTIHYYYFPLKGTPNWVKTNSFRVDTYMRQRTGLLLWLWGGGLSLSSAVVLTVFRCQGGGSAPVACFVHRKQEVQQHATLAHSAHGPDTERHTNPGLRESSSL